MLYESKTWCLKEKELTILQRIERAIVRAIYGVKMMDRKSTDKLMDMLGLNETLDKMAKTNGVRWYDHILRREKMVMFYRRHWNLN